MALCDAWPAAGVLLWVNGEGVVIAATDPEQLSSPTLWRRLEALKRGDGEYAVALPRGLHSAGRGHNLA